MTKQKQFSGLLFGEIPKMYFQVIMVKNNTTHIATTFWKGNLGLIVDNK